MLTDIKSWCEKSSTSEQNFDLSPALAAILIDKQIDSREKFIQLVREKLDRKPRYMDIAFSPPQFPFDNAEFQDPFYLVEESTNASVDLGGIEALEDKELDNYLSALFDNFTYNDKDSRRLKKKELLNFVGRQYFYEAIRDNDFKMQRPGKKKQREFSTYRGRHLRDLSISGTMNRGLLRRKTVGGPLLEKEDLVNFNKQPQEKTDTLVAIDRSNSMGQDGKLEQAKRAALSFYHYRHNYFKDNRVEFVTFSNDIEKLKPLDILSVKAEGMTHTAGLLNFAFTYFKGKKHQSEFYLITDGYPQHESLGATEYQALTLKSAKKLSTLSLKSRIILLNAGDEEANQNNIVYNQRIAKALKGEVTLIHTHHMAGTLLRM